MNEKDEKNILALLNYLSKSKIEKNIIQQEFCANLLDIYLKENIDIYMFSSKKETEILINEGLLHFKNRRKKFLIRTMIFNIFTGLCVFAFVYLYLYLSLPKSIFISIIASIIEYIVKKKVNEIVFVTETKRIYAKYVDNSILGIRESEDISKLWK